MYAHAGMWLFSIRGGAILPHHGMARHVVSRGRRELGGGGDWTFPFKVPVVIRTEVLLKIHVCGLGFASLIGGVHRVVSVRTLLA